jgi:hypothetical protein
MRTNVMGTINLLDCMRGRGEEARICFFDRSVRTLKPEPVLRVTSPSLFPVWYQQCEREKMPESRDGLIDTMP